MTIKFIDLFAGLGGFHVALRDLGHECVFACEIDEGLRETYKKNFGMHPFGDLRLLQSKDILKHDILCAGFPCQPFSKAGGQKGTKCPKWGDLFESHVIPIMKVHKPKYVILENVPNLGRHNNGRTWEKMQKALAECGYDVRAQIISPHDFGIPQIRHRMFIVGCRTGLDSFEWPKKNGKQCSIKSILDKMPKDAKLLSSQVMKCLTVWQDFLDRSPKNEDLPSFPIWTMEFEATYPYEDTTPHAVGTRKLQNFKGAHGFQLSTVAPALRFDHLPSYARVEQKLFPSWKVQFIQQNRSFYQRHKKWIKPWLPKIFEFPPSLQKFEWNCKGEKRDIWQYVIQFRASGVRVKRPTTAPSLVAMTSTQVPIIAWEKRYMTPRECSRLQSMDYLQFLPDSTTKAYEALGNAVNVEIVRRIAETLCNS